MITLSDKKICSGKNIFTKLSWGTFEKFSNLIVNDIKNKNYNLDEVCLLGIARGGLPLLTYVSHNISVRNISIVQAKMTKSDNLFDYGNAKIILDGIREDFKYYILFEDIIYKGSTIELVQNFLKEKNKKILEIYSLVADEKYINPNIDIKIKTASIIKTEDWVKFPWEDSQKWIE